MANIVDYIWYFKTIDNQIAKDSSKWNDIDLYKWIRNNKPICIETTICNEYKKQGNHMVKDMATKRSVKVEIQSPNNELAGDQGC